MRWVSLLLLLLGFQLQSQAGPREVEVFDRVWSESKGVIYPKEKLDLFTEEQRLSLRQAAGQAKSLEEFAPILNEFLFSLQISHTAFLTEVDPDYYFLRSLFSTFDLKSPAVWQMGAQFLQTKHGFVVKAVLDGGPADQAGLRRGDEVLFADGRPFHPHKSFNLRSNPERLLHLDVLRNNQSLTFQVKPVFESLHFSLWKATDQSFKVIQKNRKRIGYFHLWAGTSNEFLKSMKRVLAQEAGRLDGLILDLRDGFGGAWWDFLDPFYPDTSSYFEATWMDREGRTQVTQAPQKSNLNFYSGPMVVLVNEGVRSGKEALAFQFQKTKRALLVGEKTAGAFVGGRCVLCNERESYILFMSNRGVLLDGVQLEGQGVRPDLHVPYPLWQNLDQDPQLKKGIELLFFNSL